MHGVPFEEAWRRVRTAAEEVRAHEEILLSDPVTCDWVEVPNGWSVRAWVCCGKKFVLVVNPSDCAGTVRISSRRPGTDSGIRTLLGPQPARFPDGILQIAVPPFGLTLFGER